MPPLDDLRSLTERFDVFATLAERNGAPPTWRRTATFATLVRFVLEQQVSLASAAAAYARLESRIGAPLPEPFLELTDEELLSVGFSRQKTRYTREIAVRMLDGSLDLERVTATGDEGRRELLSVTGIGPWTVACYELFVVGRPDVWPTGDRALYVSMAKNLALGHVPVKAEGDGIAAQWSPYRSTAAKMLWHDYLGGSSYTVDARAGFGDNSGMVSS
ncbi:MAG: DNA-3-methyladenine glycosylase 2 family protein [Actinomycetia bacterium]|nr:DNA-3-methyladenine glycosylase 2 family protein [Actinomycetes bacterium]